MSRCFVIKEVLSAIACIIELWMHLGGLLSTQEARVALGYRLVRLLRFFRAWQPLAFIHNSCNDDVNRVSVL